VSFVEALLAVVVVTLLAGMAGAAVWGWSRQGRRLELRAQVLEAAAGRLEMLTALPVHRRPGEGRYVSADAEPGTDMARVLEPRDLGGQSFQFELQVTPRKVRYPDYFFGAGEVEHDDFRGYRLFARAADVEVELVTFR
jgi:hypothetical protein